MQSKDEVVRQFRDYVENHEAAMPITTAKFMHDTNNAYPKGQLIQTILPAHSKTPILKEYGFTTLTIARRPKRCHAMVKEYFPPHKHLSGIARFYWHTSVTLKQRESFFETYGLKRLNHNKWRQAKPTKEVKEITKISHIKDMPKQEQPRRIGMANEQDLIKQLMAIIRKQVIEELFDKMTEDK